VQHALVRDLLHNVAAVEKAAVAVAATGRRASAASPAQGAVDDKPLCVLVSNSAGYDDDLWWAIGYMSGE
jgi:hypothetical protein